VVRMELGKSLKRMPFMPGIQSIVVSKYPFVRKLSSAKSKMMFLA
jgi:hypothetical protein